MHKYFSWEMAEVQQRRVTLPVTSLLERILLESRLEQND
jgi:hypothetical protein